MSLPELVPVLPVVLLLEERARECRN